MSNHDAAYFRPRRYSLGIPERDQFLTSRAILALVRSAGMLCEQAMLRATNGVNTQTRLLKCMIAALLLSGLGGCIESPDLTQKPDFVLATPIGPASVSVRQSLPGMTDEESEALFRIAMQQALPRITPPQPIVHPLPRLRIVWHVIPEPRGASSRLVVVIFDGSDPFWYDEEMMTNDDPRDAMLFTVEGVSKKLAAAVQQRTGQAVDHRWQVAVAPDRRIGR